MSSANGHHSQDLSELKEYTLEGLETQVKFRQSFNQNFLKLPRAQAVGYDAPGSTLLKTSLGERIRVGHVHIICGPGEGQTRCVQAYVNSDTDLVGIDSIHFCLADDTVISRKSILQVDLKHPFSDFRSSTLGDEVACTRLRTLALYYFLARGFVRRIGLTDQHLCSFELACATAAKKKALRVSSYGIEPISGVELFTARKRCIDEANGESVEKDAGSRIEPDEKPTRSAKKRKMDDGVRNDVTGTQQHGTTSTPFVEYQKLVQTIREQVNTENNVLKAENESLKTELAFLRTREARRVKDNESLHKKSEENIKRLEAQVNELQTFKMKIQSACGAG